MPGHDNIDVPVIDKRSAQVLSIHGNTANVMDSETYETFDLNIPEELKSECVEGCNVLYWVILDQNVMKQVIYISNQFLFVSQRLAGRA